MPSKTKAETVETPEEPEAPDAPETDDAPGVEAPEEAPEGDEEGEAEASSLVVSDPEEVAFLINARKLREAATHPEPGPEVAAGEQVLLEDERSQKELDLRVVNQQILGARQALSAAKLNRLLNAAGLLPADAKQHENQFRQDIHEIRQGIELMKAIKAAMGPYGIDEPPLVGLEVPGPDGLASLAK